MYSWVLGLVEGCGRLTALYCCISSIQNIDVYTLWIVLCTTNSPRAVERNNLMPQDICAALEISRDQNIPFAVHITEIVDDPRLQPYQDWQVSKV